MSSSTDTTASAANDDLVVQPLCAVFRRFLKRKRLKFTTERAMILDAVLAKKGVFGAEELMDDLRESGHRVSKATVYRTLKHLVEARILSEVLIDSRQAHYELTFGQKPKGHLVCVETNEVVEFEAPEIEQLRDRVCAEHGYDPVSVRLVVYGVSPNARDQEGTETSSG